MCIYLFVFFFFKYPYVESFDSICYESYDSWILDGMTSQSKSLASHVFITILSPVFIFNYARPVSFVLSLFRERVPAPKDENVGQNNDYGRTADSVAATLQSPPTENANTEEQNGINRPNCSARSLLKSASISASKCVGVKDRTDREVTAVILHYCVHADIFL